MKELFEHYPKKVLDRFKKFHAENPQVFREIKKLAFQMKSTGRKKYSIEVIINVLRWHTDLKTTGDVFELNNDFKSIYARLLVFHNPEMKDFFEFRVLRSKGLKSEEQLRRESEKRTGVGGQQVSLQGV